MMPLHHVAAGDVRLAVHTAGQGLPLVLLHAFPLDHSMWREQAVLADDLRLVVPDLRGFGQSHDPAGPVSMAQLADDVAALLDALHVERAVVCGVSMGGYVAQHVAARHPGRVSGLVLVDTRLEADTDEARAGRGDLAGKVGRLGLTILADAMVPRLLSASGPRTAAVADLLHETIRRQPVATVQAALVALGGRPDMTEPMRHVRVPTLLINGADDVITPPACLERALDVIPGARLLVLPNAGHLPPLEVPAAFNAALRGFLGDVRATG